MTLAVDKLNALVTLHVMNAAKEDQGNVALATEGLPDRSNKSEHFNYKGEWVNA